MKTKFLLYGITVAIVASLFSWKAMLADAEDDYGRGGSGSGGSSYRSSGPGSGSWSAGGHK